MKNNVSVYNNTSDFGKYKIILNGKVVGKIKSKETLELSLDKGEYTMLVRWIGNKSKQLTVVVGDSPIGIVVSRFIGIRLNITTSKSIAKVIILDTQTKKGMAGSMIKESLFGTAAALSGGKRTYTFLIEYIDGTREIQDVKGHSKEFKKLIQYLEMPKSKETTDEAISHEEIEMFETME